MGSPRTVASRHTRHMIPAGGCPPSPQTPTRLLPQEGPAGAAGLRHKNAKWRCGSTHPQAAQGTGEGPGERALRTATKSLQPAPCLPKVSKVS